MREILKFIDFNDDDAVVVVGNTVPGDMVVDGRIIITTAFSANSVMNVGFVADNQGSTADPNALVTAAVMTSAASLAIDEIAASTNKQCTVADQITASLTSSGAITAGKAIVWLLIANENPLNDDS